MGTERTPGVNVKRKAGRLQCQGILVVDKEVGITSHDAVQRVRRIFGIRQVGHAGTLDPVASGVLVILVGSATRIAQYLQEDDKEYHLTMVLGTETDTQDITGEVLSRKDPSGVTRESFQAGLEAYRGSFFQTPPRYSAVKVGGQPLYRLARKGISVDVEPREVTIYDIDLVDWAPPRASLRVVCSKGTYMRTLCHDLGQDLGVGGCMESLVRTRSGRFTLEDSVSLDRVARSEEPETFLQEAASGLPFPLFEPDPQEAGDILMGRPVPWTDISSNGFVSITAQGRLLALGEITGTGGERRLSPRKILEPEGKELFKQND